VPRRDAARAQALTVARATARWNLLEIAAAGTPAAASAATARIVVRGSRIVSPSRSSTSIS